MANHTLNSSCEGSDIVSFARALRIEVKSDPTCKSIILNGWWKPSTAVRKAIEKAAQMPGTWSIKITDISSGEIVFSHNNNSAEAVARH